MVKTTNPKNSPSPLVSSGGSPSPTTDDANHSQNPTSPFYIHPSENPTCVLVSSVLIGNNYHSWNRSFSMVVISKNKYGFLTGIIFFDVPLFSVWERCNNLVFFWLFYSLSPSITQSVIYLFTASSVW
ncbi:uncharacterized protein DS421_17g576630 [Arachis hypogaea]|nr:uncharacterized protein DS421_17g576630 [Arachis hypogaea]